MAEKIRREHVDIHTWFGLSYSNSLVLHRSLLQSMPDEWQRKFTKLVDEIENTLEVPSTGRGHYDVKYKDGKGRYATDPVPHYNRGRTVIPSKKSNQPPTK